MTSAERREIVVSGVVQGVGFRPFVYSLASRLNLAGFVQNRSGQVVIEVEAKDAAVLNEFTDRLQSRPPPLAVVDHLSWESIAPVDDRSFRIIDSESDKTSTPRIYVSPDLSTCARCRRELFDAADRRFRYPFLNCTDCGPRLTIIRTAPYDRVNTTMDSFELCDQCRAEYEDPNDRRFHAEAIACPQCGPSLRLLAQAGERLEVDDPLSAFCAAIRSGQIGALKGIGGYHLVCDATSDGAVAALRKRKHRDEKPFAVMFRDTSAVEKYCEIDRAERALLTSPRRPIVLLRRRTAIQSLSRAVAPGNPFLGVMLPSTPLHELLLDDWGVGPLVMTSGNRSDEPIAHEDSDAIERLDGIADLILTHDRSIRIRCDDSVTRVIDGRESPIRRSRGYAPMPLKLPRPCAQPMLALGGQLKNTFALARGDNVFLSHHVGDLEHLQSRQALERDIDLYERLFEIEPQWIVHDLHPDYALTAYALQRGRRAAIQTIGVQHHHAHLASCMAEHRLEGEVIGVILDGSGYGSDGTIWGGEFLIGGYNSFQRAAHLRPQHLPGGDQAAREPWRMALSYLRDAQCDLDEIVAPWRQTAAFPVTPQQIGLVLQMLDRDFNSPMTSSAGRLFDAVAAITGVRMQSTYEGQAAMELEAVATNITSTTTYPYVLARSSTMPDQLQIDTRPLIQCIAADRRRHVDPAVIARSFHNTLAAMIVETCGRLADQCGLDRVVLSGGVFHNALLTSSVARGLIAGGLRTYRHHLVPPGDGGLSLGQAAIAASQACDALIR